MPSPPEESYLHDFLDLVTTFGSDLTLTDVRMWLASSEVDVEAHPWMLRVYGALLAEWRSKLSPG